MAEFMNEQLMKKKPGPKPKAIATARTSNQIYKQHRRQRQRRQRIESKSNYKKKQFDCTTYLVINGLPTFLRTSVTSIAIENAKPPRCRPKTIDCVAKSNNNAVKNSLPKWLPTNQKNNATIYDHVPYAREARAKRQRQSEVDAANVVPADLMNDEEIDAARTAPLTAPNEAQKQHIVSRTRAALSDANQGQRVCAVCDECVFKNESRLGPSVLSVDREVAAAAMFRRSPTTATRRHSCRSVRLQPSASRLRRRAAVANRIRNGGASRSRACCKRKHRRPAVRVRQAEPQRHRVQRTDVDLQLLRVVADAKHFGQQRRRRRRTKTKRKKRKEKKRKENATNHFFGFRLVKDFGRSLLFSLPTVKRCVVFCRVRNFVFFVFSRSNLLRYDFVFVLFCFVSIFVAFSLLLLLLLLFFCSRFFEKIFLFVFVAFA